MVQKRPSKRALSPIGDEASGTVKRTKSDDAHNDGGEFAARRPLNDLPGPPEHQRPSRQLFIFGSGEFCPCILGLGTHASEEIKRPRMHAWFESAIQGGVLGEGEGASVEQVAAGGMHTLVVDELGRVWTWGVNDHGTLGRLTIGVSDPDEPTQIVDSDILESQPLPVQRLIKEQFRAVRVAAGDNVSVALSSTGQIRAWGGYRGIEGFMGFDPFDTSEEPSGQPVPVSLPGLEEESFVQIECGSDHVIALTQQGTVYTWGNGQLAQLGRRIIERRKTNGFAPERLPLRRIIHVAAGSYTSFAISERGVVYAWGLNNFRQTGIERTDEGNTDDPIWMPTEVPALSPKHLGGGRRVVQISGGEHHTLFLLNDGAVYGCGRCDGFELGLADDHPEMMSLNRELAVDGVSADSSSSSRMGSFVGTPTLIPFPPPPTAQDPDPPAPLFSTFITSPINNPIVRISAGTRHNLALSKDGHAYAWGLGASWQLGLGPKITEQKTPARIRCQQFNERRKNGNGWLWKVEDAAAGGNHCILVARKVE